MTAITHYYKFTGAGEDFGPRSDGMVTFHTWESDPVKTTVADAMAGLVWQDGDDVLGSYNRVVCFDGVISAVPDDHASGGINPGSAFWNPKAWLYTVLDADEIANPNYFTLNICARGQRAYYDLHGWPPSIIDGMAQSWIDEEKRIGRKVVPTNHADFQTNRSDAGAIAMALIKKRYAELIANPNSPVSEDDVINDYLKTMEVVVNRRANLVAGATARRLPAFNPQNYDENKIYTHPTTSRRTAFGWVTGTNLTLADGTVFDARVRWLAAPSADNGVIFYHERDVTSLEPIELADCSVQDAKIVTQADIIAAQKTSISAKNKALDEAIAAEKVHAPLTSTLVDARRA